MQTYTIEAAQANLALLLHRAERGEELLITEREKPIARIGPPNKVLSYQERIRGLRGSAPGIDTTVEREGDRV